MASAIIGAAALAPTFHHFLSSKTSTLTRSRSKSVATLALLFVAAVFPQFAYAMDYSTGTGLVRDFVSWLFVDAGPYVFMAILGICVLGVPKGWIPMKGAVIAVICSFVFFAVPSIVRYAASVASSQI
ncbi:mating pair formation protein [Paraburkholderia sp. UYCP14C]|uniref:mating pair formation protein n=1 Tax=Paraburkholderia sp. UYCP14C TaxID=2511130 RepID=UPI00101F25B4|nr:mating pair formation protein [Paraburkholderia sp. UYCP14C]RZF25869.1 mating pair formation protein [Paraburkholderia sp. UYCP14C]